MGCHDGYLKLLPEGAQVAAQFWANLFATVHPLCLFMYGLQSSPGILLFLFFSCASRTVDVARERNSGVHEISRRSVDSGALAPELKTLDVGSCVSGVCLRVCVIFSRSWSIIDHSWLRIRFTFHAVYVCALQHEAHWLCEPLSSSTNV